MNLRPLLIAVCLTVAATLAAEVPQVEVRRAQMPSRFVRFEGLANGACLWNGPPLFLGRLAGVTVILNRLRFGTALIEGYGEFDGWSGNTPLPLRIGYTLYSRPVKTQFFYNAVPDIYVEVSGSPWGPGSVPGVLGFKYGPALRAALRCDVDYGGVGARLEAGWADIYRYDSGPISRAAFIYAGIQLRLLTFGIGF